MIEYTRTDLAGIMGVSRISVHRWANGQWGFPKGRYVERALVNGKSVQRGYVYTEEEAEEFKRMAAAKVYVSLVRKEKAKAKVDALEVLAEQVGFICAALPALGEMAARAKSTDSPAIARVERTLAGVCDYLGLDKEGKKNVVS